MKISNLRICEEAGKQEHESIHVSVDGTETTIWLHDYDAIYQVPGLYEKIFIEAFAGKSHEIIPHMLLEELEKQEVQLSALRVLDLGAGVGLVGERLRQNGVQKIFGIDVVESAKVAVERDRPDVYSDFLVADVSALDSRSRNFLESAAPNCLVCVSSLNVLPTMAWRSAYNALSDGSTVALNIVEGALNGCPDGDVGSNTLVNHMIHNGCLEVATAKVYRHRLSSSGESINYSAVVGRKLRDVDLTDAQKFNRRTWNQGRS